jgi:hypothetical protein
MHPLKPWNSNEPTSIEAQQIEAQSATQHVIEFLSDPEVSLADASDLPLLLADADELRQAVETQWKRRGFVTPGGRQFALAFGRSRLASSRARFQSRLDLAAGFFDPDAQAHHAS